MNHIDLGLLPPAPPPLSRLDRLGGYVLDGLDLVVILLGALMFVYAAEAYSQLPAAGASPAAASPRVVTDYSDDDRGDLSSLIAGRRS